VFYLPLFECFCIWKILHNVKLLGEHFDQSQVGCQSIAQLGFVERQGAKTLLSSMLPRTYTMAIFANMKYSGKEQEIWMPKKCTKGASKDSHELA